MPPTFRLQRSSTRVSPREETGMDVSISRSLTARLASALVFTILTLWTSHATACDVCAIYFGTALQETRPGLWAGVAQQFTAFDTTQLNGDKVPGRVEWMEALSH
jgi:hypothetical protein